MKIEKIHLNKIKVTFTPDDLIEHNITLSAVKENAPRLQNILMSVVRRAEEEVGFVIRRGAGAADKKDGRQYQNRTQKKGEDAFFHNSSPFYKISL